MILRKLGKNMAKKAITLQLEEDLYRQAQAHFKAKGLDFDAGISQLLEQAVKPKKPAKAQHHYRKALSAIPFYVDYQGAKAEVYWRKRNELAISAGAILVKEAPLNKDGSLGFAARFALNLRQEHADAIDQGRTTKTVVLKSVNEVGHFLYFAGTNSWLQLKDEDGHTLDELSR